MKQILILTLLFSSMLPVSANDAEGTAVVDVPKLRPAPYGIQSEDPPAEVDETIVFPDDAGVIDVTKPPYNAVPDGKTDCSDAIQKALDDYSGKNRIIYLPNGTYLVSHTLDWGPSQRLNPKIDRKWVMYNRQRLLILQGQNRDKTIIKLKDNCAGFQTTGWNKKSGRPTGKPVIYTGGYPAQRFRNAVRNLTINTGTGNAGAIGMQFNASNQGGIHRVKIISGDGQGPIGLDIGYCGDHGPGCGRHIEVEGFDYGVWASSMNGMTLWDVKLSGQKKIGLQAAGNVLMVHQLRSTNSVPAVKVGPKGYAYLTLVDASLQGGAADQPAVIYQNGWFYARDITAAGYGMTIKHKDAKKNVSGKVAEFSAHAPQKLFEQTVTRGLRLPIKYAPEVPWGDIKTDWANVMAFGAKGDGETDDTAAIQKAIDSGAKTVYFPGGHTFQFGDITVPKTLQRLIGCETYLNGYNVYLREASETPVIFERFIPSWSKGKRRPNLHISASRPVIVRDVTSWTVHQNSLGDLFIEDLVGRLFINKPGARVWCRYLNYEPNKKIGIVNNGGYLWLFGGKTEHFGPKMILKNNSYNELLGSWWYASFRGRVPEPGIHIINSKATITGHRQFSFGKASWPKYITETRGATTKVWKDWNVEFFSARIDDESPPGVPDGLKAKANSESSLTLSWSPSNDADSGIGAYRIYRAGRLLAVNQDASTSFTETGLKEKTSYTYMVSAVNWGGAESRARQVTITTPPDTTAPALVGVVSLPDRNGVRLAFSEPIAAVSAELVENYSIDNNVAITGATLAEDNRSVVLQTSELAVGTKYTATVKGVTDRAAAPNTMTPATVKFDAAGDGLLGMYFADRKLTKKVFERVDPTLKFHWGKNPGPGIGHDNWGARWTGFVMPQHSEVYTFYVKSDDGSRLWVDGKQLVNQWKDQGPTERRGTIKLEAGKRYSIKVDFYERAGGATCELRWSSPSTPKQIIPSASLYSGK